MVNGLLTFPQGNMSIDYSITNTNIALRKGQYSFIVKTITPGQIQNFAMGVGGWFTPDHHRIQLMLEQLLKFLDLLSQASVEIQNKTFKL